MVEYAMKHGLLIALFLLLCGCYMPAKFSSVTILDAEFNQIRTLSKEETESFEAQWYEFKSVKQLPASLTSQGHYKIDIVAEDERFTGRWLYYPSGYIAKLNKALKPAFIVEHPNDFVKSLGI